ncbi:alpha/beta hydrolase fold domain-containing protein [Saccharicrinis sp. 156]|uniref:alpha/beta hydrolase fold domain-containing protein n=1 Tax=Saccharicrinis sp. 156 TaxID=3417574 RepID=UPI003D3317CA
MKLYFIYILLLSFLYSAYGQEPYQLVYAQREFMRLDKDGDNVLEQKEVKNRWETFKKFDSNGDDVVSLEEYSAVEIPYLNTSGEKNLNIKYKSTPEEDLYLDIYYPPGKTKNKTFPVMVYVHGGGWFNGSKENITKKYVNETFSKLVEQGFAVASVNYRLTKYKSVVMRDCVIDAMDAIRYLSKHHSTLKLNTNSVYVLGDSAGGQLAQMITLADASNFEGDSELYQYKYKVKAGVSWYGPCDFTKTELFETNDPTKKPDRFRGRILRKESDPSLKDTCFKEMSSIFYLNQHSPPLYMMAAEDDTTIPVSHAYHMKKRADEINANVEIFIAKNAGHNWRNVDGEIDPSTDAIIQKTVDFFIKYK